MNGENERYRLVRPLATGGMAELFLGVARGAEGFEKPVAIKRVLPHLAKEPAVAQMFLAEARLSTHLQHQNIASVYDVGSGPGGLFLVMELVDGWDLGALLRHAFRRGRRFPPHLVAFIGAQVLAGLVHAYRRMHGGRPVMRAHRDISPSIILVSREGEVKVTDFGIARLEGVSMGTQPGTFKGKVPYAAPETLQGKPATAASDQFSLGIVLYELLAGRHPFGDANADPLSYAWTIPQNEPPPLPQEFPAPLSAVVMRALAKAPEDRFPRPEDMAEALARYLAQAGEPATSQALADFLASLNLPPTLLELSEQAERDGLPIEALEPTVRRPSLATRPVEPVSFDLQDTGTWDAQPGGPALSMSGRLTVPTAHATPRCVRCNAPLPSAHAPCDRCARELAPGLASLAEDPSDAPPPPGSPAPEPRPVMKQPEEPLELAERGPRPPP
ncbi:MAG TPA: serine/threonine-protein kinase, partial [Myxococcaceae bacterium]|nr:serine/threonine-protein kinase [Myxococcaceae bacterium]